MDSFNVVSLLSKSSCQVLAFYMSKCTHAYIDVEARGVLRHCQLVIKKTNKQDLFLARLAGH